MDFSIAVLGLRLLVNPMHLLLLLGSVGPSPEALGLIPVTRRLKRHGLHLRSRAFCSVKINQSKYSSFDAESSILEYQVHPIQRAATNTEKRLARYQALDEQFGDLIASYSEQNPLKSVRESHNRGEEKSNAFSRGIPMKFYDRVRLKTLSRPLKFQPIDFETRRDLLIQSYLS